MTHIRQRRGTTEEWTEANPVLRLGEVGWDLDSRWSKLGDGTTAWNDLDYLPSGPPGPPGPMGSQGSPVAWDTFMRPDGDLNGKGTPSGHTWRMQNPDTCYIEDNALVFNMTVGQTSIAYLDFSGDVTGIYTRFEYVAPMQSQNMVLGCAESVFNQLSFQTACWATPTADTLAIEYGVGPVCWQQFSVYESEDYTLHNYGQYRDGFTPEPGVVYAMAQSKCSIPGTVISLLIDGSVVVTTAPEATTNWGKAAGFQMRRAVAATGSVRVFYAAVDAPAEPRQPYPGNGLVFDGTAENWAKAPFTYGESDDLEVRLALDVWTQASSISPMNRWGTTGGNAWYTSLNSVGSLILGVSVAGATSTVSSGTSHVPIDAVAAAITRVASTGEVNFYTANTLGALDHPVSDGAYWTLLKTVAGTAGVLDQSKAPLLVAKPHGSGSWFSGTVTYAGVFDGIGGDPLAVLDLRERWTGIDVADNRWQVVGKEWVWEQVPVIIPPYPASVVTEYGPGSNIPVVLDENMKTLGCQGLASGGGGGSGRRGADGTDRFAGGGGAGGGYSEVTLDVPTLWAAGIHVLYLDVGAKGTGGAAVTTDDTNGSDGTNGSPTRLKTDNGLATSANVLLSAAGGAGGGGGTNAAGTAGGASTGQFPGGAGRAASTAVAAAPASVASAPSGGGSGGTVTSGDAVRAGGPGAPAPGWLNSVSASGGAAGVAGGDGTAPTYGSIYGTSGAGGGGSRTAAAGRGGHGARGAGGGGGGASKNGFDSGAGGDGGDGFARVIINY